MFLLATGVCCATILNLSRVSLCVPPEVDGLCRHWRSRVFVRRFPLSLLPPYFVDAVVRRFFSSALSQPSLSLLFPVSCQRIFRLLPVSFQPPAFFLNGFLFWTTGRFLCKYCMSNMTYPAPDSLSASNFEDDPHAHARAPGIFFYLIGDVTSQPRATLIDAPSPAGLSTTSAYAPPRSSTSYTCRPPRQLLPVIFELGPDLPVPATRKRQNPLAVIESFLAQTMTAEKNHVADGGSVSASARPRGPVGGYSGVEIIS